ncbi:hypothetical protein [Glutamicibacter sp. AOP5-A2-18]|uniref:hypothetical protein n=1 Tax=Glutamicibacter sp. AOP5-A2-18 TaxID=3457656 RepID=UPI0040338ADC
MKPILKSLSKGGAVLAARLLLTSSAVAIAAPPDHAGRPDHVGPPGHAGPPSWAPAPEHAGPPTAKPTPTPEPTEPTEDPGGTWRTVSLYNVTFDLPQDWEIVEDCEYGCQDDYSVYKILDSKKNLALDLETTSFRDTDNPNTYKREVLDSAPAPDLQYAPTSVVSYYREASLGDRDLSVAVIIDDVWQNWTEAPAIDYFKTSAEETPIMAMNPEYLHALGLDEDGDTTLDEAKTFVASEQYSTLKKVLTSVRETP